MSGHENKNNVYEVPHPAGMIFYFMNFIKIEKGSIYLF